MAQEQLGNCGYGLCVRITVRFLQHGNNIVMEGTALTPER